MEDEWTVPDLQIFEGLWDDTNYQRWGHSHLSINIGVSETPPNGIEDDFKICDKRFTRLSLSKLSPAKVTRGGAPRK